MTLQISNLVHPKPYKSLSWLTIENHIACRGIFVEKEPCRSPLLFVLVYKMLWYRVFNLKIISFLAKNKLRTFLLLINQKAS